MRWKRLGWPGALDTENRGIMRMSLNGIWKFEMLGPHDWEPVGTAFLRDGHHWGGSTDHYAVGTYEFAGKQLVTKLTMVVHGKMRTMFGKRAARYELQFEGDVSNDKYNGVAKDSDGAFLVRVKATKIADLP